MKSQNIKKINKLTSGIQYVPSLGASKEALAQHALLAGSGHWGWIWKRHPQGCRQHLETLSIWLRLKCRQRLLMLLYDWDITDCNLRLKSRWKMIAFWLLAHCTGVLICMCECVLWHTVHIRIYFSIPCLENIILMC